MKKPIPLWVYLATAALAVALMLLTAPMYLFDADGGHYVGLARSLADSGSYMYNGRHEVMYPPGVPLLLAPAAVLFDGSFIAITRWATALSSLVFPLTYVFAREQGIKHPGYVATVTVASTGFLSLSTGNPVSDLVYMAFSLVLLIWWERTYAPDAPPVRTRALVTGAVLMLLVISTRTIGIAALVAVTAAIGLQEWKGHRRLGASTLRAFIPVFPAWIFFVAWTVWTITMHETWYSTEYMNSYLHQLLLRNPHSPDLGPASLTELALRPFGALVSQAARLATLLTQLPFVKATWFSPLIIGSIGLVLSGCWRTLRTGRPIVLLYLTAYAGVLLMWPFDEGERFLVPIVPILWVLVARGVAEVHDTVVHRPQFARGVLAIVALVAMGGAALQVFVKHSGSRQDLAAFLAWAVALGAVLAWNIAPWGRFIPPMRLHRTRLFAVAAIVFVACGLWVRLPPVLLRTHGKPMYTTAESLGRAAEWLKTNAPPDAVVQATFADEIHFATGRRTVGFPVTLNVATLSEVALKFKPQFLIVLDSTEFDYFKPTDELRFRALSEALDSMHPEVAYEFRGGRVFKLSFTTPKPAGT